MVIRKFNRYELKYVLRFEEYQRVRDELAQFMQVDEHADAQGGYSISSLYYDSRELDCYRNKLDGVKYRRKLRVRTYMNSKSDNGFVEIKQRINRTVQKRRIVLPIQDAYAICAGDQVCLEGRDEVDHRTADEAHFLVRAMNLRPQCIITYRRFAFVGGRYDLGLRVTFDIMLKYRTIELDLSRRGPNHFFLPPDICIMEIKANERVPIWLTAFLGKHECKFSRISKYCLGMSQAMAKESQSKTVAYLFSYGNLGGISLAR